VDAANDSTECEQDDPIGHCVYPTSREGKVKVEVKIEVKSKVSFGIEK
jgi:hypothetical protein